MQYAILFSSTGLFTQLQDESPLPLHFYQGIPPLPVSAHTNTHTHTYTHCTSLYVAASSSNRKMCTKT